ncbi:hypothetical protein SAMN05443270_1060 [Lacrimispora sphenoides]|uniref:hypothetical protein n=1 Tax=Lacrimispora sphenoides TaxID=29370 RepID=UPI0008C2EEF6|nr:hypothetical protein [Lacrimispora sphenoides]SET70925.1 hypothetical protein SAMN05443270_1060 [Lacrimispora sphenoides]
MELKTNYKNDKFTGMRRYQKIDNTDGSISLNDVTAYAEIGDIYSADDINMSNKEVNRHAAAIDKINTVKTLYVPVAGWGNSVPYSQTILVTGSKIDDAPIVGLYLDGSSTAQMVKNQTKAFGCLDRIVFGQGTATLYCYNRKPAVDFYLMIKG